MNVFAERWLRVGWSSNDCFCNWKLNDNMLEPRRWVYVLLTLEGEVVYTSVFNQIRVSAHHAFWVDGQWLILACMELLKAQLSSRILCFCDELGCLNLFVFSNFSVHVPISNIFRKFGVLKVGSCDYQGLGDKTSTSALGLFQLTQLVWFFVSRTNNGLLLFLNVFLDLRLGNFHGWLHFFVIFVMM